MNKIIFTVPENEITSLHLGVYKTIDKNSFLASTTKDDDKLSKLLNNTNLTDMMEKIKRELKSTSDTVFISFKEKNGLNECLGFKDKITFVFKDSNNDINSLVSSNSYLNDQKTLDEIKLFNNSVLSKRLPFIMCVVINNDGITTSKIVNDHISHYKDFLKEHKNPNIPNGPDMVVQYKMDFHFEYDDKDETILNCVDVNLITSHVKSSDIDAINSIKDYNLGNNTIN